MTYKRVIRAIKRVIDVMLLRKPFRDFMRKERKKLKDAEERAEKRSQETPSLFAR